MSDLAHSAKHVVYGCPPNSPEQPRAAHLCGFSRTSLSPVSLSAASERRRQLLSAARRTPLRPAAPYSAPPRRTPPRPAAPYSAPPRRARLAPSDSGRPAPPRPWLASSDSGRRLGCHPCRALASRRTCPSRSSRRPHPSPIVAAAVPSPAAHELKQERPRGTRSLPFHPHLLLPSLPTPSRHWSFPGSLPTQWVGHVPFLDPPLLCDTE